MAALLNRSCALNPCGSARRQYYKFERFGDNRSPAALRTELNYLGAGREAELTQVRNLCCVESCSSAQLDPAAACPMLALHIALSLAPAPALLAAAHVVVAAASGGELAFRLYDAANLPLAQIALELQ